MSPTRVTPLLIIIARDSSYSGDQQMVRGPSVYSTDQPYYDGVASAEPKLSFLSGERSNYDIQCRTADRP